MPELPEVETVRSDLERLVVGRRIEAVDATGARTLRRYGSATGMGSRLAGRRLASVDRRGKYLLLRAGGGEVVVVHLGMSGQLLYAGPEVPRPRHTHVAWRLDAGDELRFVDPRTFGEVFLSAGLGPGGVPVELAHLGADPFDPALDAATLGQWLAGRRTRLKVLLLGQRVVAGIGNIYSDEILWGARLGPDRPAGTLSRAEVRRLHESMRAVLAAAIAHRGSSLADQQYRDLSGRPGGYQALHQAYGRAGEPCARCSRPIRRDRAYGRSTFSCPRCQR